MSVQRDNNRAMNNILRSIELCEQHVRNQSDYIKRIDAATKREGDASVIQTRQLNTMATSIGDHGRALQSHLTSIKDLLTEVRMSPENPACGILGVCGQEFPQFPPCECGRGRGNAIFR
jgi:hypothetical protein